MTTEATGPAETPEPATTHETMISREVHRDFMLGEALATQTFLRAQALRLAQENTDLRAELAQLRKDAEAFETEAAGVRAEIAAIREELRGGTAEDEPKETD